ncbi:MAG: MATE family efflux transporter [Planctomycetota bacterium]
MNRAIWVLCWPVLVESYLNSFVGLVDTMLAARIGEAASDAVGPGAYFMWFIGLIAMALGVGATALISRSVGKGRFATANAAVGQTVALSVVLGAVVGGLIYTLAPFIARMVGLSGEAEPAFVTYMRIVAIGVPASSVLFSGISCLRGAGDSMGPLRAMLLVNLVNLLVSWSLAGVTIDLGFGSLRPPFGFSMGLAGVAWGTVAAHTVGAIVILFLLTRDRGGVHLKRSRLLPHRVTIARLFRIGLPNFLESLGMWFGNFLIVLFVGWIASDIDRDGLFGAHIIAIRVEAFSFLPGFAMGTAVATLAGQYLGAGSPELARRAIWRTTLIGAGVMTLMGVLFITIPGWITARLTPVESHMDLVPPLLVICGLVQLPFGIALVVRSALRGAGDVKVVMIITWITTYGVRLPLAYALSGVRIPLPDGTRLDNPFGFEPSLSGLWIGLCLELAVRGAIFAGRFLHGGWARVRV